MMTPKHRYNRRDGYAMVVVMVLILTSTAMAAVHARYLTASLRIEQARMKSETRSRGPLTVLAIACQRIETGIPTTGSVSYRYSHNDGIQTVLYRITYQATDTNRWTVTADPDPTATTLPMLPQTF